jgi:hypothetical protein
MGYAARWTCAPIVGGERLEELLGVEPPARLVALVPIGRPAKVLAAHKRLPLEKVLSFRETSPLPVLRSGCRSSGCSACAEAGPAGGLAGDGPAAARPRPTIAC